MLLKNDLEGVTEQPYFSTLMPSAASRLAGVGSGRSTRRHRAVTPRPRPGLPVSNDSVTVPIVSPRATPRIDSLQRNIAQSVLGRLALLSTLNERQSGTRLSNDPSGLDGGPLGRQAPRLGKT